MTTDSMPLRALLVGLGGVAAELHLPAIARAAGVVLAAGVDPSPDRRAWALAAGVPVSHASVALALQAERPDFAIVATPPETHREICAELFAAGVPVLCEKPLAPSVADAQTIVADAARAGVAAGVNNQYRFTPVYRAARAAMDSGEAGAPYLAQFWQQMRIPGGNYPGWKAGLRQVVLYEFGTHVFDLASFVFGALPVSVSAKTMPGANAELTAIVRLDFPDERVASISLNWQSHAPQRYLEARVDCEHASLRLSLGGVARVGASLNNGVLDARFGLAKGGEAWMERAGRAKLLLRDRESPWSACTAASIQQFAAAVRAGAAPEITVEHGAAILGVALAAVESAERGGELVRLQEAAEA